MELKFFKNNKHIFTIHIGIELRLYFNAGDPFSSIYDILGKYSNKLNNDLKYWYDLAKKSFNNNSDIIFCSNIENFLLLLKKKTNSDHIYLKFDLRSNFFGGDLDEDNNNINDGNFILIAKPSKLIQNDYKEGLKYTILEIIPTKDNFAILLSFLVSNVFFLFSLKCITNYNFLIKNLKTDSPLKKVLKLDKNINYIYENIIKYQDLIYDTILDSLKEFYSSNDIYELLDGSFGLIDNINRKITPNLFGFYLKYYLNKDNIAPLELEEYLILMDKILNKKSKF